MDNDKIRKSVEFSESKAIDPEHGIYEAWISTESIDRDGDIIVAEGVEIERYMNNPVVLFGHSYRDPNAVVGKTLGLKVEKGKGIRARWQFAPPETNWSAQTVHRLWAGGFLNATSVGFISKEYTFIDAEGNDVEDRQEASGRKFNKWELLEWSLVPVPANQDALRLAIKAMGIDDRDTWWSGHDPDTYTNDATWDGSTTIIIPTPFDDDGISEDEPIKLLPDIHEADQELEDPTEDEDIELTDEELGELADIVSDITEDLKR